MTERLAEGQRTVRQWEELDPQLLAGQGIAARVIDAYSVKPIDAATLRHAPHETGRVITGPQ